MRNTQGAFSFLPDLTDKQISLQVAYCLAQGWAVGIEHTTDPHPRNTYWDMWGPPMFDLQDPKGFMMELAECRVANPDSYIRLNAFDSTRGWETVRLSFMVHRPKVEPGFHLDRVEAEGRTQRYSLRTT